LKKEILEKIRQDEHGYETALDTIKNTIINNKKIKLILIAGGSCAGKTTTTRKLCEMINASGRTAHTVSLDDYYRNLDESVYLPDGTRDIESINSLRVDLIKSAFASLLAGEETPIPMFDFKTKVRTDGYRTIKLNEGDVVLIEGLHALNPKISSSLDKDRIFKLFVSVSTNISDENRRILSGRKTRFIRRLVRDSIYRGATAERTLAMWKMVLAAEDIYLYPYKETADTAFNTFHPFELSVMKGFALDLISKNLASSDPYAKTVLEALEKISEIDSSLVPENSLIREFIPGGIYESLY